MTHTRLWIVATIIAGIILAGFVLSVPHTRDISEPVSSTEATITPPVVKVRDTYKKGTHTITGSVEAPNACTVLSAAAVYDEAASAPAIRIALSMPKDTGICLQQSVALTFSVTVGAPANMPITATVNDMEAAVSVL